MSIQKVKRKPAKSKQKPLNCKNVMNVVITAQLEILTLDDIATAKECVANSMMALQEQGIASAEIDGTVTIDIGQSIAT